METRSIGISLFLVLSTLIVPSFARANDETAALAPILELRATHLRGEIGDSPVTRSEFRPRVGATLFGTVELSLVLPVGFTNVTYQQKRGSLHMATTLSGSGDVAFGGEAALRLTGRESHWSLRSGFEIETLLSDGDLSAESMSASYRSMAITEISLVRQHVAFELDWWRITAWVELGRRFRWGTPYLAIGVQDMDITLRVLPDSYLRALIPRGLLREEDMTVEAHGTGVFAEGGLRARLARSLVLEFAASSTLPINGVLVSAHAAIAYIP